MMKRICASQVIAFIVASSALHRSCSFTSGFAAFCGCCPRTAANDDHTTKLHLSSIPLTIHSQKQSISTFEAFEESVLDRIQETQQQENGSSSLSSKGGGAQERVVRMSRIRDLLQQENHNGIKKMVERMDRVGGYLIIELDNPSESDLMVDMWRSVHDIAFPGASSDSGASPLFRQQVLSLNDETSSESGYRYIETSIRRHDNTLSIAGKDEDDDNSLETLLGKGSADVVARAFQLLFDISIAIVDMAVLGSRDMGENSSSLAEALRSITDDGTTTNDELSEADTPWSCTVHRLCRYATTGSTHDDSDISFIENIRSHTDWTLMTLVPASNIVGLEIWNPTLQEWTQPEVTARRHHLETDDDDASWNAPYIVVMAGKWLEILTNGKTQAAVHRVVASNSNDHDSKARMSAPFFLRPRNRIATDIQKNFGADSGDVFDIEHVGTRSAVDILNSFLWQRYLLRN